MEETSARTPMVETKSSEVSKGIVVGTSIRVLIVESCPATRLGMRYMLESESGIRIMGEAAGAEEALKRAEELGPEVVLSELVLGGEPRGTRLCRELKGLSQPPRVLFYSYHSSPQDLYSLWFAGADGYLHKGEEPSKLPEVVREVCAGKGVWLLGRRRRDDSTNSEPVAADDERLTRREREVFRLVLQDLTNNGIAKELGVSVRTVKSHKWHIFKKLDLSCQKDLFR